MSAAKVFQRMYPKLPAGSTRQPSRALPLRNTALAHFITLAVAFHRTPRRRQCGIARLRNRERRRARRIGRSIFLWGRKVPQDEAQAAFWYRKAAERGDVKAQSPCWAGIMPSGQGVPQDYAEAYFWLTLLLAGNVTRMDPKDTAKFREEAGKTRDLVASLLTPADLSREQERARKWFEDHPAKPQFVDSCQVCLIGSHWDGRSVFTGVFSGS